MFQDSLRETVKAVTNRQKKEIRSSKGLFTIIRTRAFRQILYYWGTSPTGLSII